MASRANHSFGRPRRSVQDVRPAQKPPEADTSVLVHDCFDQFGGETKPDDCGCAQRTSQLDAAALIRRGCADALVIVRYGKSEKKRDSIVLRPDYVAKRRAKTEINPKKAVPAILKLGSKLSFKRNVIRAQNGTPIELDMKRTDALYWNSVLVHLGLGASAGKFLDEADAGKGLPASLTTLENFKMAPAPSLENDDGLDPEINATLSATINEKREGVQRGRHKVGAAGFIKGTSGGLTYGKFGEVVGTVADANAGIVADSSHAIHSAGNLRDSDEDDGDLNELTGQIRSENETLADSIAAGVIEPKDLYDASRIAPDADDVRTVADGRSGRGMPTWDNPEKEKPAPE
jgi:hypothetical protein